MWTRDQIDKVRSSIDMVDVIRDYVPSLTARGRSVKGLCPFHQERTPSFHVHPEKGLFKCFGCGEAGDVIAFFSKMESVRFTEAVERLASRAGIALERKSSFDNNSSESSREKCLRALEAAKKFYQERLNDDELGKNARAYLRQRKVSDETTHVFQLGFAPQLGGSAFEVLIKKGFAIEILSQVGLVSRSKEGRYFDPLFGRLIFPIMDSFGHVVGFGGRILPAETKKVFGLDQDLAKNESPKYINSPDSPVFSKGRLLYGLNQAKPYVLESRKVVILEGYMDVIGVHQAGYKGVVATLGTAFTKDHAKLVKRYADEVISFFDPDAAGQAASLRGLEPIIQEDLFPRVVTQTTKLDPDELVLKEGLEYFQNLIQGAPDFVDYLMRRWNEKGDFSLPSKIQGAQQIINFIRQSPNEILKGEWAKRVAGGFSMTLDSLRKELEKSKVVPKDNEKGKSGTFIPTAEEELLQLLINAPTVWQESDLEETDFLELKTRALFNELKKQLGRGKISIPQIHEEWPEDEKAWLLRLAIEEKDFSDPQERYEQLVQAIRMKKDRKRLTQLSQIMARGEASVEHQAEYRELLQRLKGSAREMVPSRN